MPRLTNVCMLFPHDGQHKLVLDNLSLDLPHGKTCALMGPSGSGKTTILRLLAGIISPTSGNVTRETNDIAFMFQDSALLPWLSALDNVNLVLSDQDKTKAIAADWLARVGLENELNSRPAELSGGMQQRVALARALAVDADLLLLDEPFRGLDEALHDQMLDLIARTRKGKTTVFVTHDKKDLRIADFCFSLEA